ncbi:pyocin activator PrtN family protein [Stenotrophomonas acidaminiphila]
MTTTTVFLLLAEFGTGHIPLERCCHHFGMKPKEANRRAARQSLPVPVFRLGSQKSPGSLLLMYSPPTSTSSTWWLRSSGRSYRTHHEKRPHNRGAFFSTVA